MKKIIVILLVALVLGACSPAFINAQGQRVKACTTDFECEKVNNF